LGLSRSVLRRRDRPLCRTSSGHQTDRLSRGNAIPRIWLCNSLQPLVHAGGDQYLVYEDLQRDRSLARIARSRTLPDRCLSPGISVFLPICGTRNLSHHHTGRDLAQPRPSPIIGRQCVVGDRPTLVLELVLAICFAIVYQRLQLNRQADDTATPHPAVRLDTTLNQDN
jgi:hypothetical protein